MNEFNVKPEIQAEVEAAKKFLVRKGIHIIDLIVYEEEPYIVAFDDAHDEISLSLVRKASIGKYEHTAKDCRNFNFESFENVYAVAFDRNIEELKELLDTKVTFAIIDFQASKFGTALLRWYRHDGKV